VESLPTRSRCCTKQPKGWNTSTVDSPFTAISRRVQSTGIKFFTDRGPQAANVLISDKGTAVICDFGLSRLKQDLITKSHHDQAVGSTKRLPRKLLRRSGGRERLVEHNQAASDALGKTIRWQSPERLGGAERTYENDVYAFAMTVYEVRMVIDVHSS
jgi:serine/threonine protein kinase